MLRATGILQSAPLASNFADVIALDYDQRRRRRIVHAARGGLRFMVDLAAAPFVKGGDAFVLEDGRLILVEAAPEPLMEIACADPQHLARLAWHIGNRHLAAELRHNAIRIRSDHVIKDMALGLGAHVEPLMAPFDPERGAYREPSHGHHQHNDHHDH